MTLPAMDNIDEKVLLARRQAAHLLKINRSGPMKYVSTIITLLSVTMAAIMYRYYKTYKQYQPLLDGTASLEINDFLKEEHTLSAFSKVLAPATRLTAYPLP